MEETEEKRSFFEKHTEYFLSLSFLFSTATGKCGGRRVWVRGFVCVLVCKGFQDKQTTYKILF